MRFEVVTAVKMPVFIFWAVTLCGTNVSEEHTASILRAYLCPHGIMSQKTNISIFTFNPGQ
jgi:hypothetical protein